MTYSRLVRLVIAVCASLWIVAPSLLARVASDRGQPLQIDSPIAPPVGPIAPPFGSPVPTPHFDPAECDAARPCNGTPTPESGFQAFLPGVSQPESADSQPPGPPPDLGTLLNYVAAAVVVIGVTLKVYWWISDRRKARG